MSGSKYFIFIPIILVFLLIGCIGSNKTQNIKDYGLEQEEFVKEYLMRLDNGDVQFIIDNSVDEYGNKINKSVSDKFLKFYTETFGNGGENILIKSISITSKYSLDLNNWPRNTKIEEIYRFEFYTTGEAKTEKAEEFFEKFYAIEIAKIGNRYYFYAGWGFGGQLISLPYENRTIMIR